MGRVHGDKARAHESYFSTDRRVDLRGGQVYIRMVVANCRETGRHELRRALPDARLYASPRGADFRGVARIAFIRDGPEDAHAALDGRQAGPRRGVLPREGPPAEVAPGDALKNESSARSLAKS